jgi:Mn-dependent DtxR family transcriptional regulator
MSALHDAVLQSIYEETGKSGQGYLSFRRIEIEHGITGYTLRNIIEDLRNDGLVNENENGVFITPPGVLECRSRWA